MSVAVRSVRTADAEEDAEEEDDDDRNESKKQVAFLCVRSEALTSVVHLTVRTPYKLVTVDSVITSLA